MQRLRDILFFCAYGNEVGEGRATCIVDRCCVLSVVSFRTMCQVVSRGEMPLPFIVGVLAYEKTEVLAVVIFVLCKIVENHATVHLPWIA